MYSRIVSPYYALSALQHITVAYFLNPNYVMPIHLIRHSQSLFKNIDLLILSLFSCVFDWRVVNLKGDVKTERRKQRASTFHLSAKVLIDC